MSRFFDPKRYDLANVGTLQSKQKLDLKTRLLNLTLAETLVDPETGENHRRKRNCVDSPSDGKH